MFESILKRFGLEYYGRYYASYRGFVSSNEDPEFLGRLQLMIPQVSGDKPLKYWAWPKGNFAGANCGMFFIPSPKDGVWVSFENGDPQYPIWEQGWWGNGEVPAAAKNNGNKPTNNVIQTKSGHRLEMDDFENRIRIVSKSGLVFEMNSEGKFSLGKEGEATYHAARAEKAIAILEDLIKGLEQAKTATSIGAQPLLNRAYFTGLKEKLSEIKSDKVTLE